MHGLRKKSSTYAWVWEGGAAEGIGEDGSQLDSEEEHNTVAYGALDQGSKGHTMGDRGSRCQRQTKENNEEKQKHKDIVVIITL